MMFGPECPDPFARSDASPAFAPIWVGTRPDLNSVGYNSFTDQGNVPDDRCSGLKDKRGTWFRWLERCPGIPSK